MALPWIPLIGLGATILGGMMGKDTGTQQSSTANTTGVNSTKLNSINNTAGKTNTRNVSTSNQDIYNRTNTINTGSSTDRTRGTIKDSGTQTQSATEQNAISRLDAGTRNQLTSTVRQMLSSLGGADTATSALLKEASAGSDFDADSFVNGIMSQAQSIATDDLESGSAAIRGRIGGAAKNNSAGMLLEQKLKNQIADNMSGIRSKATGEAERIRNESLGTRAGAVTSLGGQKSASTANLLQSLLQASETQTGTSNIRGTTANTQTQDVTTTGRTRDTGISRTVGDVNTRQVDIGSEISKILESITQNQDQASTSTTNSDISENTKEQDWTNMFANIGKMFGASF